MSQFGSARQFMAVSKTGERGEEEGGGGEGSTSIPRPAWQQILLSFCL